MTDTKEPLFVKDAKYWVSENRELYVSYGPLHFAAMAFVAGATMTTPKRLSEDEAVEVMYAAARSEVRGSTHTKLDMRDALRALREAESGKHE